MIPRTLFRRSCPPEPDLAEGDLSAPHQEVDREFQFADLPPGARAGRRSRIPPANVARGSRSQFSADPGSAAHFSEPYEVDVHVLDWDWSDEYEKSDAYNELWHEAHHKESDWPDGLKVFRNKLYYNERLCVPEALIQKVLQAHHEWLGHMGVERSFLELSRRFEFPPGENVKGILMRVKQNCLVCQACDRPNWALKGPIAMTLIPERFMASVCLDVFSMPIASWGGSHFDAFLMCVDRHSGWMVAKPTQKSGLSGEKAAHLMLDATWGELGVPSVITSDQGSQFISQWWLTMCSRLGIRCAY